MVLKVLVSTHLWVIWRIVDIKINVKDYESELGL